MAKAPWRFDARSSLLTLVAVALVAGGYRALEPRPAKPGTAKERVVDDLARIAALKIGVEGTVLSASGRSVAAGRTREAYAEIAQAEDEGDDLEVQAVVASGRGLRIPARSGATLVQKDALGAVRIRFTGGDLTGEEAWTSGEYFH